MDLLQCTGVTPAPALTSQRVSTAQPIDDAAKQGRSPQVLEARQPLQNNNSQTSPSGSSSQRGSHTASQSIVVTPSEKRQTVLALSPVRSQQWNTLEVQRVLSLTPGNRPGFRRSSKHPGSIESMPDASLHGSPRSCSTADTVPAVASPASHHSNGTRQRTASPHCSPSKQPARHPFVRHDPCPATELQLADLAPTQLACAATALDLLMCEATQVVAAGVPPNEASHVDVAITCNDFLAQAVPRPPSEPVLILKHAEALGSTPMLQLADAQAIPHGRAPAGPSAPTAQPLLQRPAPGQHDPAVAVSSRAFPSKPKEVNPVDREDESAPIKAGHTERARWQLPGSNADQVDVAKPVRQQQEASMLPLVHNNHQAEIVASLQHGTLPSSDPSSLATGMQTLEATLSQVTHQACARLLCRSSMACSWALRGMLGRPSILLGSVMHAAPYHIG